MPTFAVTDATNNTIYFFANSGSGTSGDPYKTNAVEVINTSDIDVSLGGESLTVGAIPSVNLASQVNPFSTDVNVSLDGESVLVSSLPSITLANQVSPFTSDIAVTLDGESVAIASVPSVTLGSQDNPFTSDIPVSLGGEVISVSGSVDVTPSVPSAADYLPVRLTDGTSFYNATAGGGASSSVEVTSLPAIPSGTNNIGSIADITGSIPLPADAATDTNLNNKLGAINESPPLTDTAASGLNGRLQRLAQRITSLLALFPSSLGQKDKADSLAVAIASDQDTLDVSDSSAQATLSAINAKVPASPLAEGGSVSVSNQITGFATSTQFPGSLGSQLSSASFSVVQASDDVFSISASSLPLPTGAATESTLGSLNAKIPASPLAEGGSVSVSNQISGFATETTLSAVDTKLAGTLLTKEQANDSTTVATFGSGEKLITTAGIPEALEGTSNLVEAVLIERPETNTGDIEIGSSNLSTPKMLTENNPTITLSAPNGKKIDLSTIWLDSSVDGEGVVYLSFN